MTAQQPGLVGYVRNQVTPGLTAVGGFVRMCVLTAKATFRSPFQWREFILQGWFLMRVAFLPTIAVAMIWLDGPLVLGLFVISLVVEIINIFIGSATAPNLLSFGLYYLANHPEVVKKAREELDAVVPAVDGCEHTLRGRRDSSFAAVGMAPVDLDPDRITVSFNGSPVCVDGVGAPGAREVDLTGPDVEVVVDLAVGGGAATIRTTDLSHAYVEENSAYSS